MSEVKPEHKPEDGENYAMGNNVDPKNVQELTQYVSYRTSQPFFYVLILVFCPSGNKTIISIINQ
jgi:hypothetical protein